MCARCVYMYMYLVIIYINEASGIKYTDAQNVETLCVSQNCPIIVYVDFLNVLLASYPLLRATITRHEQGNERGTQVAKRTINFLPPPLLPSPEREEDRRSGQGLG